MSLLGAKPRSNLARAGARTVLQLQSVGIIAAGLMPYVGLPSYESYYPAMLPIFYFFVFDAFTGFAIYLLELFPRHVRPTGLASPPVLPARSPASVRWQQDCSLACSAASIRSLPS